MLMHKTAYTLLLCLIGFISFAQQPNKDSLKYGLANSTNDSLRPRYAAMLTETYQEINPDSAFFYAEEELAIAKKLKFRLNGSYALGQMGYALTNMGDYPRSLQMLLSAIPFFTTKPTGHGTGLGLSLAYDIVT